jgi:hypothetical protein
MYEGRSKAINPKYTRSLEIVPVSTEVSPEEFALAREAIIMMGNRYPQTLEAFPAVYRDAVPPTTMKIVNEGMAQLALRGEVDAQAFLKKFS